VRQSKVRELFNNIKRFVQGLMSAKLAIVPYISYIKAYIILIHPQNKYFFVFLSSYLNALKQRKNMFSTSIHTGSFKPI